MLTYLLMSSCSPTHRSVKGKSPNYGSYDNLIRDGVSIKKYRLVANLKTNNSMLSEFDTNVSNNGVN